MSNLDLRTALWRVGTIARLAEQLIADALEGTGMSAVEYAVVSLLGTEGPSTPGEIAQSMAAPPSTLSSVLDRLERRGVVTRQPNPDDARSMLVRLSDEGRDVLDEAKPAFRSVLVPYIEALGTNVAVAEAGLGIVERALRSVAGRPAPANGAAVSTIVIDGPPLTEEEAAAVRDHVAFLRWRATERAASWSG